MAWALYSAYHAITASAVLKLHIIKLGIGEKALLNKDAIAKLVKVALPHRETFIKESGDSVYHILLDELEARLLAELQNMLKGVENDMETMNNATEILKRSNELSNTIKQAGTPNN